MTSKSILLFAITVAAFYMSAGTSAQAQVKYESNKPDLKKAVERGGWVVAWADDVKETDVAAGVVAAGVSVATANPAPFLAWVERLVQTTITSFERSAKKRFPRALRAKVKPLAAATIKAAIKGRTAKEILRKYDTVDFKAGAIKYSGRNFVQVRNPINGKKTTRTISRTWGMKPYIAFRWRGSRP